MEGFQTFDRYWWGGMLWISGDICAFWYLFIVKHILNIEENCNITNFSKSTTFPYSYTLYIYNKGNPLGDYFCVPPWSLLLAGCRYIMVLIETGLFTPADPAASCHHKSWPALTQRSHHIASSLLHLSSSFALLINTLPSEDGSFLISD